MAGRTGTDRGKGANAKPQKAEGVVSILPSLKNRAARTAAAETPAPFDLREGMSADRVASLGGGYEIYEIGDERQFDAETRSWRAMGELPLAARSRSAGTRIFSVRDAAGFCRCMVDVGGDPLSVRALLLPRLAPSDIPAPMAVGRFLAGNGVDLSGFGSRFATIVSVGGGRVFLDADGCPDKAETAGDVHMSSTEPLVLPKVMVCAGDLMIVNSAIARNPVSATVRGSMTMEALTGLVLPSHLVVERDLVVRFSDARFLPSRFSVGRDLDIAGTPVSAFPEHFNVGRHIRAAGSMVSSVPAGLTVRGDLDLAGCPVQKLAWGLDVKGTLDVSRTEITEIPGDAVIGGDLRVDDHVSVPSTVSIGGRLMYARPYGYEMAPARRGARDGASSIASSASVSAP